MIVDMATDATVTQARSPLPSPSARNATARQSSVRPARRMSNRPPPKTTHGAAPVAGVRQTANASPVVRSVTASPRSSEQNSPVRTSVVRDELVRAVMPELQVLMHHLVDTAVERAITPLLKKQQELEAALKELRNAQVRPEPSPITSAKQAPEAVSTPRTARAEGGTLGTPCVPTASGAAVALPPATAVARPVVSARSEVIPAAVYDTYVLTDLPSELNGSRRKKATVLVIAGAVILLLLSAIVLSVLSNRGTYL